MTEAPGKGSIHFCGNGQHLVEPMLEIPDLCGFDFGQAKMMDVKKIYEIASQRKVALTCLKPSRNELISGQAVTDFPTGVVMAYNTESIDDAYEVITAYRARQDRSRNKTASYPKTTDGTIKTRSDLEEITFPDLGSIRKRIEDALQATEGTGLGVKYRPNNPCSSRRRTSGIMITM